MKQIYLPAVLFLITFWIGCAKPVAAIKFGDLKDNESIVVNFRSSGCFHYSSARYVFEKNRVSIYDLNRPKTQKPGVLKLKTEDIIGLDKLISYYHSRPEGMCTTTDYIIVKLLREGKTVRVNQYTDGTCFSLHEPGAMTFQGLERRLKK